MVAKYFTGVLLLMGFGFSTQAHAIDITKLALGKPTLSGNGCPKESVGISQTPDQKTVSLIFDNYVSAAGNSVELQRDVKKCTATYALDVPKGYQIVKMNFDLRGFYSIPKNGRVQLKTTYDILNSNNKKIQNSLVLNKDLRGPAESEYTRTANLTSSNLLSLCGQKLKLRFTSEIHTATNNKGEDVLATLESIDSSAANKGIDLFIYKCKK